MFANIFHRFRIISRRLWVRCALISASALLAAFLAPLGHLLPFGLSAKVQQQTLQNLLDIITNSMLAVATFSLSIMVTAHLAADSTTTPRAHRLLQQDSRTQTVIATFIGAFIYALTMTILLDLDFFEGDEFGIVYIFTVVVLAIIVLALLRWVGHLDGLGSVEMTLRRVEERVKQAIREHGDAPYLGGRAIKGELPAGLSPLRSDRSGYVQNIAMEGLSSAAEDWRGQIWLAVRPGAWLAEGDTLAHVSGGPPDDDRAKALLAAFSIEDRREPGQDLTQSLIVLAEIGERALSPGINDPRTGVDTISRLARLILAVPLEREVAEPLAPRVFVPPLATHRLVEATLEALVRDGASFIEIHIAAQAAARALSKHEDPDIRDAAHRLSARSLAYAGDGLLLTEDRRRVAERAIADGPAATGDEERSGGEAA